MDGIYYKITDVTNKTVEVSRWRESSTLPSNKYTGSITIPSSVTYNDVNYSVTGIGIVAFLDCSELTNIKIPSSVTSIGEAAFYGCTRLTNIEIPNSVTNIGGGAFHNTTWYNNQPDGVVYAGKFLYEYKGTIPPNTTVIIKEGTLGIAGNAFWGELTNIEIPNSVTNIGWGAFHNTTWYNNQPDGVVYAGKVLYEYKGTMPPNTTVIIKEGTLCIEKYAFHDYKELTNIEIPNSVTSIGKSAFEGCSGLTSITIGNSVTSIGKSAFEGCTGLTNIEIPNSVTCIGESAFQGCTGLTNIEIPNSVTCIGEWAFEGCSGLTSITIGNSVTSIGEYAFYSENIKEVKVTAIKAIYVTEDVFSMNIYDKAHLYVPNGCKAEYIATSSWGCFKNVKEFNDINAE